MGRAVEVGAGDSGVAEGVEGMGFGGEETCGDRNVAAPTTAKSGEAGAGAVH